MYNFDLYKIIREGAQKKYIRVLPVGSKVNYIILIGTTRVGRELRKSQRKREIISIHVWLSCNQASAHKFLGCFLCCCKYKDL